MQVKRTWRARRIYILDTSIMTALWLNWNSPGEVYRTISKYWRCRVTYRGVRDVGKNPHGTWSARLISTHGTFTCCSRSPLVTGFSGVMLMKRSEERRVGKCAYLSAGKGSSYKL